MIVIKNERNHLWFLIKLVRVVELKNKFNKRTISQAIANFLYRLKNWLNKSKVRDTPELKF
jgi:hypothetical protein